MPPETDGDNHQLYAGTQKNPQNKLARLEAIDRKGKVDNQPNLWESHYRALLCEFQKLDLLLVFNGRQC